MPQRSKLIRSRDDWKTKAVSRADELRYRRKAEKRLRGRIAELERQVEELRQAAEGKKIGTADSE
jgi:transposase-like protein